MASISPPTTRGPQNPGKYPRTGPTYAYYGEQPGFVYNPWTDRYVVDPNAQREYEEQQGIREKEPKQPSAGNQLATTIGGLAAGTVAVGLTKAGVDRVLADTPKVDPNASGGLIPKGDGAAAAGPTAATQNTGATQSAAPSPAADPSASGGLMSKAPTSAGSAAPVTELQSITMPDGTPGKLMSDGGKVGTETGEVINPDGTKGGTITGQALAGLQIAGGAAQMYAGYRQYKNGEKLGGAANVAGGAFGAAAGAQALAAGGTAGSLASYVPGVGWVVAGAQIGQQMLNSKGATEDRAAAAQYEAQKASLLFIPGYGWVAYAAIAALDAATGGKAGKAIMGFNKKMDNQVIDKIDFGIKKSLDKKLFHQSTRGVQQEHTGQLMQQSDDPTWQNYVAGMRAGHGEAPKDPENPFGDSKGNKFRTFDEYKASGLDAANLSGVYGNIDAFKPDYAEKAGVPNWAELTLPQQHAVTQRLIDENMYSSKKGEVVIGDKEKARRIYEEMAKTNFGAPPAQPGKPGATAPVVPGAPVPPPAQPGPAPLQPGQTPQSTAAAAGSGQPYQPVNPNGTPNGAVATGQLPAGQIDPYGQSRGLLAAMPPRSNSVSPGFDKNGRRINYGKS